MPGRETQQTTQHTLAHASEPVPGDGGRSRARQRRDRQEEPGRLDASPPVRLCVRDLTKHYGRRAALEGVSLDLTDGVTALVGPNGSGKSTLMRAVVGIGGWDGGSIAVDGVDLSRHPKAARARVGYMPERISLPAEVRVEQFLRFAAASKGLRGEEADAAVEFVLEAVGIHGEWRRRLVGNLSKGFRQRVGLAQAIVGTPPLLVIDEPLSGLDPVNLNEVGESIRKYAGGGRAVLLSTHQLTQARTLADRVIVVSQGQILYDGPIGSMSPGADGSASVRLGLTGHGGAAGVEEILAGVGGSRLVDKASNGNGHVDLRLELGHEALVGELVRAFVHKDWTVRYLERITDPLEVAFRNAVQGTASPDEIGAVPGRSE